MANPFRVKLYLFDLNPGLSLRSNPGLELANAFGVNWYTHSLKIEPGAELDDSWRVVDLRDTSEIIAVDIQPADCSGCTVR